MQQAAPVAEPEVEEMQDSQVDMAEPVEMPEVPEVDFETWWVLRSGRIPAHHHKEIVKADFKGRGLGHKASMAEYDAALKAYGL